MNHEINHNSGEGDIHPNGESYPRQTAMLFAVVFESVKESHQDQRDHYDGEQHMGNENRKIQSFDPAQVREGRAAMVIVVGEVTHEENARKNESRNHEFFVGLLAFFPDGIITKDQTKSRQRIEHSIEERELFSSHRRIGWRTFSSSERISTSGYR